MAGMYEPTVALELARAAARLRQAGVDTPEVDARLLLGHVLGLATPALVLERDRRLTPAEVAAFAELLAARAARRPLQHLLGAVDFHGRRFEVRPGVLIPRFETEWVAALALTMLDELAAAPGCPLRAADIGTGTGVIAITLAAERPELEVVATDSSRPALALAAANARALGVARRVHLVAADLGAPIAAGSLDLLVANPPYLAAEIIPALAPEVRDHDPRGALDGGRGGLHVIARILADVPRVLRPGGRLVLEIGDEQGATARALAAASGLTAIAVHPDLAGRDRILAAACPR